ncbi:hypothetical protein [Trinickia sp.]|uniref:hypothetical protein n=1 Tax=Trinickia sp. TaxID=2571163 RepID=UPI003F7F3669
MSVFQYPKTKHERKLAPPQFKRYQTYKRYLQAEFVRVCVYCRQPDSSAPNLNFGVDHYRPKGLSRFASLVCDYANLFYCCGNCNSRKNDDWPLDERAGPFVVNPCDHEMAAHLWFDGDTGRMEPRTTNGRHTEELLQLNDDAVVQYRRSTLRLVRLCLSDIASIQMQRKEIGKKLRKGQLSQADYDAEHQALSQDEVDATCVLHELTGQLPLPPLSKPRRATASHP